MGHFLARAAIPLLLLLLSSSRPVAAVRPAVRRRYHSIFSFGDSNTDTGNDGVVFARYGMITHTLYPPYGSTFTGRGCDGRLVIDFIAERLDLPLVPPFLAHGDGDGDGSSLRHGANFAVGVATARDASFFQPAIPMNVSLSVQLQWFESLMPSLWATPRECQEFVGSSLFFVGEIGFNDYSLSSWLGGMSVKQLRSLVPDVISSISMAIERLIKLAGFRDGSGGMHAGDPRPVRRRRRPGELRPPEGDERAVRAPQHAVAGVPRQDPGRPPVRRARLRRFLQPRHGHGGVAGQGSKRMMLLSAAAEGRGSTTSTWTSSAAIRARTRARIRLVVSSGMAST